MPPVLLGRPRHCALRKLRRVRRQQLDDRLRSLLRRARHALSPLPHPRQLQRVARLPPDYPARALRAIDALLVHRRYRDGCLPSCAQL